MINDFELFFNFLSTTWFWKINDIKIKTLQQESYKINMNYCKKKLIINLYWNQLSNWWLK